MPPRIKSNARALPKKVLDVTAGAVNELKIPREEPITAVHVYVEGTYDLGGAGAVHEDQHSRLFDRVEFERTGHRFFDLDAFALRVLTDHDARGGGMDNTFDLTVGAGRAWRQWLTLYNYAKEKRNPYILANDPRQVAEQLLTLTIHASGVGAVFTGGAPSNLALTAYPFIETFSGSPGIDGKLGMKQVVRVKSDPSQTERSINLKGKGVIDRILLICRTNAGARDSSLLKKAELVINGQERRLEFDSDKAGRLLQYLSARSQGEVLPEGCHLWEADPDDFVNPFNMVDAAFNVSAKLKVEMTNANDECWAYVRYLVKNKRTKQ